MSRPRHHNVFFAYRGPSTSNAPAAIDAQLEDTTTKALINTLELAPDDLATPWLASIGIDAPGGAAPIAHHLQGGPTHDDAPDRHLVVITAGPVDPAAAPWDPSAAVAGRVDACLYRPGAFLVAVESKVTADLDGGQLLRHAEDWGIPRPTVDGGRLVGPLPPEWVQTTWPAVHAWATEHRRTPDLHPVSAFLLDQLAEYLEILGFAPFAGFRPEDLEFLAARAAENAGPHAGAAAPAADPAQAAQIKRRMAQLWHLVHP